MEILIPTILEERDHLLYILPSYVQYKSDLLLIVIKTRHFAVDGFNEAGKLIRKLLQGEKRVVRSSISPIL